MSEPILHSYRREKLSQPLCFRNFLCLFPYFVTELKPARLTSLSALEFSSTRKFLMLGILTFTIFFFDENIFSGYFLERILFVFKNGPGNELSLFCQSVERDTKNGLAKSSLN